MKITKIECIPVSIPFVKPIVMSGGPATKADAVVLKIHTDEGITGIAEWRTRTITPSLVERLNSR